MDMVYVIYKNNKIYRTGSKNDAKLKYKSEYGKGKFDLLSTNEQNKLIEEAKKNYDIRIFTDGGASL